MDSLLKRQNLGKSNYTCFVCFWIILVSSRMMMGLTLLTHIFIEYYLILTS